MRFFAVVLLFAAVAWAAEEPIPILRSDVHLQEGGEYTVDVETGDGTSLSQQGTLHQGEEGQVVVVSGSFSYIGDDGKTYTVTYTADENGYHAEGDHFPVAPVDPHHL